MRHASASPFVHCFLASLQLVRGARLHALRISLRRRIVTTPRRAASPPRSGRSVASPHRASGVARRHRLRAIRVQLCQRRGGAQRGSHAAPVSAACGPPAVLVCCRRTPSLPVLDAAQRRAHPRRTPQLNRAERLSAGPRRCWRAAARGQQPAHGSAAAATLPAPVCAAAARDAKQARNVRSRHALPAAPGGRPPDVSASFAMMYSSRHATPAPALLPRALRTAACCGAGGARASSASSASMVEVATAPATHRSNAFNRR